MRNILKLYTIILLFSITVFSGLGSEMNKTYTIVIDPGHGGKDVGAVDNGQREKEINLEVAKKLAARIKKNLKNVKVVMTREEDKYITLQERADIANSNKGDLFISIHTNSVDKANPNRKKVEGASVYALGLQKDQNNIQVARRENAVIELENDFEQKYSGFDPSKDESYIIFEMAQKSNLSQSLKFANLAQKNLVSVAGRTDKGVKQAGFWVLWATSMPAVLVELDFICNPNCAEFLGSDKGRDKLAEALYNAVETYIINTTNKSNTGTKTNSASNQSVKKAVAEKDVSSAPMLVAVEPEEKEVITSAKINQQTNSSGSRRRRSSSSKGTSVAQEYETSSIALHTESERLAIFEQKEEILADEEITNNYHPVSRRKSKTPKVDKQATPKNKEVPKTVAKTNADQRIYNNKIVEVSRENSHKVTYQVKSEAVQSKSDIRSISDSPRTHKLRTIYKIQIYESPTLLKQNDEKFCGLHPIKSFKENNKYKYTFGESEDRQEIESMLAEVKKLIPDAEIISNRR